MALLTCLVLAPTIRPQPATVAQPAPVGEAETGNDRTRPPMNVVESPPLVGWLELDEPLREGPKPFAWMTQEEAGQSLGGVVKQINRVAEDDSYLGLVIHIDRPGLTLTQVEAIGEAMRQASSKGRLVMTFSESYGMMEYLLACSADMVLLQHHGSVELHGLGMEEMYLAEMLEKIGVEADFVQIGKFKGADESLTRREPSRFWDENIGGLLDDLYAQIVSRIARGRGMTPDQAEAAIRDSWTLQDGGLVARGVVDRLVDRDLVSVTEIEFGDHFVWDDHMGREPELANVDSPFALFNMLFQQPRYRTQRDTIAVVYGSGVIHSGDSSFDDGLFEGDSIGSRTMLEVIGELRDDENIRGVVLRLDSPGGSALASEMMWQAIRDLNEQKPVYVAVGGMAASGGYYLASAGSEVFVQPQSILGSIGVVGGKLAMSGLYDWMGVGVTQRTRGPWGDLFNSATTFTDEQREMIRTSMQQVYDRFLERVAIGRGARLPDPTAVAEGRLFTGREAVEAGMADRLGDAHDAVAALAESLSLAEGQYDVMSWPRPMSLQEFLEDAFGASAPGVSATRARRAPAGASTLRHPHVAAVIEAIDAMAGPEAARAVREQLIGLLLLRREPVLTMMPGAITIR